MRLDQQIDKTADLPVAGYNLEAEEMSHPNEHIYLGS